MSLATTTNPKWMTWIGRVLSALPVLFMARGRAMAVAKPEMVTVGMSKYGYPESAIHPILIAEMACIVLYAIPQTAVLGAILLTGYLGGATATHVRAGESSFFFPILMGVVTWLGLFFRSPRVRALVPVTRATSS